MTIVKMILFALLGGYASFLAQRSIAVYHDGLRPIMPEFLQGRMSRKELSGITFAISIGFITGFAMPITLATGIIVIHIILLTADIIGVSCKNSIVAIMLGAIYGAFVTVALEGIIQVFTYLPVNFLDALAAVGDPIIAAFVAFPALTVGYQYGKKKGIITLFLSFLGRIVVERINPINIAGNEVGLSPEGIALLIGMIMLISFSMGQKDTKTTDNSNSLFEDNVQRIKKNIFYLIPVGGLISVIAHMQWIAGEPIAASLLGKGDITSAALVAFAQALAFLPLVITTSLISGVYATNGWCDWFLGLGYIAANPFLAFLFGGSAMAFEVLSLEKIGKVFNRFPDLKNSGDSIRTAMTQILEIALLIGGANAGFIIWKNTGLFLVVSLYIMNEIAKRPIMRLAAGPIAAICVGILANIFALIGLYIV